MNKTPKIRFKEFRDEWESKKLGDLTVKTGIKNKYNENYEVYSISNKYGFIPQAEQFENSRLSGLDKSLYQIVGKGEFAYNPARINVGSIGVLEEDKKVIVSSLYVCFRFLEQMDYRFFKTYVGTYKFNKDVIRNTEGSVREYLFYENFSRIKINKPKLEEQEKIASLFSLIDDKISLQGEKVEALKGYKNCMMQKIFSRELRFKDDEGRDYPEWEEKKLGDISECLDNKRKPLNSTEREEMQGDIPYYGANGVVDFINDYIFDEDIILLAEDGGNFEDFSIRPIAQLVKGKSWVNNHAHVLKAKYNTEFLFYSLVHKDIRKYINGTSRAKLNKADMLDIIINLPKSLEEQKNIANVLGSIYLKIEKEQEKLDSLNKYKKGLLQQMFV